MSGDPERKVCPRCGRGWGYGNCTHHPPCDRPRAEAKEPDYPRLDEMIRDAYQRHRRKRARDAGVRDPEFYQGHIEPEYLT